MTRSHLIGTAVLLALAGSALAQTAGLEPLPSLDPNQHLRFDLGVKQLETVWEPAGGRVFLDGLGPNYAVAACTDCHRDGGRGPGPEGLPPTYTVVLDPPDPVLGEQIQPQAVPPLYPEAPVTLEWQVADTLRFPEFSVDAFTLSALSGRVAPSLHGLGLIAAIPEEMIAAGADPNDADGDGISGRVGPGRFGWQARQPTLARQTAHALSRDMGLSSPDFPDVWGDCTLAQMACRLAPDGVQTEFGAHEVTALVIDQMVDAMRWSAPPRGASSGAGATVFREIGCAGCHRPAWTIPADHGDTALAGRTFYPHSDFLLHSLGSGLSVVGPGGIVVSSEWRTAPLWGISAALAAPEPALLHDGRAKTLEEAIAWHDGEAAASREAFGALDDEKRDALISFLHSL